MRSKFFVPVLGLLLLQAVFESRAAFAQGACQILAGVTGGTPDQRAEIATLFTYEIETQVFGELTQVRERFESVYIDSGQSEQKEHLEELILKANATVVDSGGYALILAKVPRTELFFQFGILNQRKEGFLILEDIITRLKEERLINQRLADTPHIDLKMVGNCY